MNFTQSTVLSYKRSLKTIALLLLVVSNNFVSLAQEPVCATPGADGVQEFPAPQNSFFPGAGDNITVNAGDTSFILEGIPDPIVVGGVLYGFGNNQITKGDLLLVIQMQGASISNENNNRYGSGVGDGTHNGGGAGYVSLNNVGKLELVYQVKSINQNKVRWK